MCYKQGKAKTYPYFSIKSKVGSSLNASSYLKALFGSCAAAAADPLMISVIAPAAAVDVVFRPPPLPPPPLLPSCWW